MSRACFAATIIVALSACQPDAGITALDQPDFDRGSSPLTGRIAFDRWAAFQQPEEGIYVMQLPSGTETKVFQRTPPGCATDPAWAPDGETIAYRVYCGAGTDGELFLGNVPTQAIQQITFNSVLDHQPAWSPNGSALAFVRTVSGNHEIFIRTFGSPNDWQVTDTPELEFAPAWSPDGTRLAFERWDGAQRTIVIHDLATGAESTIPHAPNFSDRDPAWSPDNSKIALARWELQNDWIDAVMIYDVASLTVVDSILASEPSSPAWSPTGDAVVLSKRAYNYAGGYWSRDLFIVTLPGHKVKRVTNTPENENNPIWTP